jgi:uncharacterized protein (TIGR03083 family)
MPLSPMPPTETRACFRPVSSELVTVLRALSPSDWERSTIAGSWSVRDVVAHLVDVMFRRLSFHRDRMTPPPPSRPIGSARDFVDFINGLNADWVGSSRRISPRLLTDLFDKASGELSAFFEALPPDAPALFGVSWAGEQTSEGWFDVGREFTELWHHQEQIRLAVGAPSLTDPRFLRAVLAIAVRGLPHAFRDIDAEAGATLSITATGPAGGQWTLTREASGWTIQAGEPERATTRVRMADEHAWRLLFNALTHDAARAAVEIDGRQELAVPLLNARSIVV